MSFATKHSFLRGIGPVFIIASDTMLMSDHVKYEMDGEDVVSPNKMSCACGLLRDALIEELSLGRPKITH